MTDPRYLRFLSSLTIDESVPYIDKVVLSTSREKLSIATCLSVDCDKTDLACLRKHLCDAEVIAHKGEDLAAYVSRAADLVRMIYGDDPVRQLGSYHYGVFASLLSENIDRGSPCFIHVSTALRVLSIRRG